MVYIVSYFAHDAKKEKIEHENTFTYSSLVPYKIKNVCVQILLDYVYFFAHFEYGELTFEY